MVITSVNNEKIKEVSKLKEKKYRDRTNTFLIEGEHLVFECYKENLLKEIFILEGEDFSMDTKINIVTKEDMKKISSTDGIPNVIGVSYKKKEENTLGNKILILDGIQDPGNLGTIIRSSAAFNIDTIVINNKCVDLYNSKVVRSTQGMIYKLNIINRNLISFIKEIKEKGFTVYGTKVDGGTDIRNINIDSRFAIIIGSEGNGMTREVSSLCDDYLYIKMNDNVESLNAGVAASIILYEVDKKCS